ncbi:MAG: D-2-hydroxyacid dehydrogenase, partial [Alphaproteobacteria bacterium]|nr:D-2-hydroxyacid dehydrogenase [Alphaproteobacteria bacterium]
MNIEEITINYAQTAYQLSTLFEQRQTGIRHFQTWTREELRARIGEGDVIVVSGYWDNGLLPHADRLRFAQ